MCLSARLLSGPASEPQVPPPGAEAGSCAHLEEAEPSPTSSQDVAQDQRAQELRVSLVFLIKPVVPCLVP